MNTLEFAVEGLESRRMLAGNLSVEVDDGNLEIRGETNTDQSLVIEAVDNGGYHVFGLDADGAATTVNGQASLMLFGVTGDVDIDMRSGKSVILLSNGDQAQLLIQGDLEIDTRGDTDIVILNELSVAGEIDVNLRGGDDAMVMKNTIGTDDVMINTGGGSDTFTIYGQQNSFANELDIRTGGGNDGVIVSRSVVAGDVDVRSGGGEDRIALFDNDFANEVDVRGGGRFDTYVYDNQNQFNEPVDLSSIEVEDDSFFGVEFALQRNNNDTLDALVDVLTAFNIA